MPNNTVTSIDSTLSKLASDKTIETALVLATQILEHTGVAGLKSNDPSSADYVLLTALALPNAERYDHWFQAHPKFKSNRACFALNDRKLSVVEAKFYALKKKSKLYISGAAHFTPNFEDALFTRQDPNSKVGIDFFLPPTNDSLLVVLSNNKSLRVVELKDRLTNTQKDIFAKWANAAMLEREQLHLTIWDSFKLKSINEAFYKGIANSFKDLVSHLEAAGKSSNEARHFANRLHGRLLFCWFLDKKGFINRDVAYFNTTHTDATEYYKDKLELLFFDTLNTPQPERERPHPDLKTPYLNGGLFEAQPDDWRGTNVPFPQGFFVRLYEHFGEFNFTTDESTPDYEQIAIDPEMLGKIFENLLAEINEDTGEQARKAKGAFYTPREIVAYMCRESVREYLYTATNAGEKAKTAIDKLLDTSDSDWAKSGTNSRRDTGELALREKIVEALDDMKVLDPACGSGAFPIGMLHLLVQLYERLDGRFDAYKTKLGIMERNIYGVDIEPLAIEIARLRSFLALVVDQEYIEKKSNGGIDTLPNLEFKFVCANTLIPLTHQNSLGDSGKYEALLEIKKEYFKADPKKREKLETKYSTIRQQGTMFDSRLNEQLQTYDPFNNDHPASFYDRHLMHDIIDTFDVVVGNPPYVGEKGHGHIFRSIASSSLGERFYLGKSDLFYYFFHVSLDCLNDKGVLSFITTNYYPTADGAVKLRKDFYERANIIRLINFGEVTVFDSARGQHNLITILQRDVEPKSEFETEVIITRSKGNVGSDLLSELLAGKSDLVSASKVKKRSVYDSIGENYYIRFAGGNTDIDIVLEKISAIGKPLKLFATTNEGIHTGLDSIADKEIAKEPNKGYTKGEGVFVLPRGEYKFNHLRPWFKGSDINHYTASKDAKQEVLYWDNNTAPDKDEIDHLARYRPLLEERIAIKRAGRPWYHLNWPRKRKIFEEQKIVNPYRAKKNFFALIDGPWYASADVFFTQTNDTRVISNKTLVAILNSKLVLFWLTHRGKRKGNILEMKSIPIGQIPIVIPATELVEKINYLTDQLITASTHNNQIDVAEYQKQIDSLIYRLYNLTPDEIQVIEHG